MLCAQCSYDLSGSAIGGTCPECGLSVAETIRRRTQGAKSSGMATAALVLGILSVAACPLLGIVAIMLYYRAMREITEGGFTETSRGMAKAGLVLGIIGTCLTGIYLIFFGLGVVL